MQLGAKSQTFPAGPGTLLVSLLSPFFKFPVSPDQSQEHEVFLLGDFDSSWSLRNQICESLEEVKGRRLPIDLM